jgi:hypothetical protein
MNVVDPRQEAAHQDDWPGLTETDRRAIAEIRRELDAEYGPLEDEEPASPVLSTPTGAGRWLAVVLLVVMAWSGATALALWAVSRPPATSIPSAAIADDPPPPPPAPAVSDRPAAARPVSVPEPETSLPAPAARPPDLPPRARAGRDDVAGALAAWLDATRRGDIAAQMAFYPPVVTVYYTWRDVPAAAVRLEKRKVFEEARVLDIDVGEPEIEVSPGGTAAVTLFRKAYVIEGPRVHRRGEVVQELRWSRTTGGWKITSERDAVVLR